MYFYRLLFLSIFIFIPNMVSAVSLPLTINHWGRVKPFEWNGVTPFGVENQIGAKYDLSLILPNKKEIFLIKETAKNLENEDHYIFYLEDSSVLDTIDRFTLKIYNKEKSWPFNSSKTKITKNTTIPKLNILTSSKKITHGGAGLVVIESEKYDDLQLLAFMDEKNIPYYPQRFQKDGFYTILFPWYTDYSTEWTNQYILVMDNAGNTNTLSLSNINALTRKYRQRTIRLPDDYAQQKAQELSLSTEQSNKLEGNIDEINKVLAQQKTFKRWEETRTSFKENAQNIITNPLVFSAPSLPMSNAISTALYGDRRKYYYQNKMIRTSVHRGLDYASYKNTPIYALLDGTVVYADWYSGNGKSVIIDHGLNTYSLYAHNSELLVTEGEVVKAGTQISISGTTGQSTGDHLHLSLFVQGIFIEPKEWITKNSIDTLFHQPLEEALQYINMMDKNP